MKTPQFNHLTGKKCFVLFFYLIFKLLLVFPFTTIIICPVTGHHLVNLLYSVCFIHLEKIPHKDESNQISPNSLSLSSLRDTPILIHLWGPWANVTVTHCGSILTMEEVSPCAPKERWMFGGTFLCPRLQLTGTTIHPALQFTEGVTQWLPVIVHLVFFKIHLVRSPVREA